MKKMSRFIILFIILISGYSVSNAQSNQDSPISPKKVFIGSQDSVYFDENSAELKEIYKANLDSIVVFVKKNPAVTLLLHAYEHEFENTKTADKRAAVVKDYLEKSGIPSNRILTKVLPTMLAQHEDAKFLPGEKEELRRVIVRILH